MRSGVLKGFFVVAMAWGLLAVGVPAQDQTLTADADRLAELLALTPEKFAEMPVDEQEEIRQEVEALLINTTEESIEQGRVLEQMRDQARLNDSKVKQVEEQIRMLRRQLNAAIMENPQVKKANQDFSVLQQQVLQLMKLKRIVNP